VCMPQICETRALWQALHCAKSSHHEVELLDPSVSHLMTDAGQCGARVLGAPHSHKLRGATNAVVKVTKGAAYGALGRTTETDHAITSGVRTLW